MYYRILGRGDAAMHVPVMDGPLKPNNRLDVAERVTEVPELDNLVSCEGKLWATSETQLGVLSNDRLETVHTFSSTITCLAVSETSRLAIGLDEGRVVIFDPSSKEVLDEQVVASPTALLFWDEDDLFIASGSKEHSPSEWQADLMSEGRSGSLTRWSLKDGSAHTLLSGLAYPTGLVRDKTDRLVFSEAWKHRLCVFADPTLDGIGRPGIEPVLTRLPGYPGALSLNPDGSIWMAVFAPRNQLVEFVLTEREYCTKMMRQVDRSLWIAPTLRGGRNYHEPMQWGAVKQLGVLKPWAPVLSYGLAVRLNAEFQPIESLHSRADGSVHGVTSLLETRENDRATTYAAAKGDGVLVRMDAGSQL